MGMAAVHFFTPAAQAATTERSMKFQPDRSEAQTIRGYGPGWIAIEQEKFSHSLIISAQGLRQDWNCKRF